MNSNKQKSSNPKKSRLLIFDFNRTLYDPDKGQLFGGVIDLLEKLRQPHTKVVVATKIEAKRHTIIVDSHLSDYVDEIINLPEKTKENFLEMALGYDPHCTWVIGDVLLSEVRIGIECGFRTVWVQAGKFAQHGITEVTPEFTVKSVLESEEILSFAK